MINVLQAKKYTSAELEELVNQECMSIGYQYKESVQSLLRGLGFTVKRTTDRSSGKKEDVYKVES